MSTAIVNIFRQAAITYILQPNSTNGKRLKIQLILRKIAVHKGNAMKGFHLLMRLGHAINALSQFAKKLKQYVKATLFNPWLSDC